MTGANFDYKYMLKQIKAIPGISDDNLNKIIYTVLTHFDIVPRGYDEERDIFYCDDHQKKLIPQTKEALLWKLGQNGYD